MDSSKGLKKRKGENALDIQEQTDQTELIKCHQIINKYREHFVFLKKESEENMYIIYIQIGLLLVSATLHLAVSYYLITL